MNISNSMPIIPQNEYAHKLKTSTSANQDNANDHKKQDNVLKQHSEHERFDITDTEAISQQNIDLEDLNRRLKLPGAILSTLV